MKCPMCSEKIQNNAEFCPKCGVNIKDAAKAKKRYKRVSGIIILSVILLILVVGTIAVLFSLLVTGF